MQHARIAWTAAFALGMAVLLCITGDVAAQAGSAPQVTFTKDVARYCRRTASHAIEKTGSVRWSS